MTCVRWYLRFYEVPVLFPITAVCGKPSPAAAHAVTARKRAGRPGLVFFACHALNELVTPPQNGSGGARLYDPRLLNSRHRMKNRNRQRVGIVLAVIIVIGLFHLATIRSGHRWGDDFALYLLHAKHLATGTGYHATDFVINPYVPIYSPLYYPPVYPAFLAMVYGFDRGDLYAFKLQQTCFVVLGLFVIAWYFRRSLPWPGIIAVVCIVGLNPQWWEYKDDLGSDFLFIVFLYICFTCIENLSRRYGTALSEHTPIATRTQLLWGLGLGCLLYLSYGTRSVAIAAAPALVLWALYRWRRLPVWVLATVATMGAGAVTQRLILGPDGYTSSLTAAIARTLVENAIGYTQTFFLIWDNGVSRAMRWAISVVMALIVFAVIVFRWRKQTEPLFIEWFAAVYLGMLALWPAGGFRFVMPLLPLIAFYLVHCEQLFREWASPRIARAGAVAVMVSIAAIYITNYATTNYGPIRETVGQPEFLDFCREVRRRTKPGELILFSRARALALFAERTSATFQVSGEPEQIWTFMESANVRYIGTSPLLPGDPEFLAPVIQTRRDKLHPVYSNSAFTLYQVLRY
jgi:hypothetical protein